MSESNLNLAFLLKTTNTTDNANKNLSCFPNVINFKAKLPFELSDGDLSSFFSNQQLGEDFNIIPENNLNTITNIDDMFYNCYNLGNLEIPNWNLCNLTSLNSFRSGDEPNFVYGHLNAQNWKLDKLQSLNNIDCGFNNVDLSNWYTPNLINFEFYRSSNVDMELLNLANWNTLNITGMSSKFSTWNRLYNIDMTNWKFYSENSLSSLFYGCHNLSNIQGIETWNIENIDSLAEIFSYCYNLNELNIYNWKTNKVINMASMFRGCNNLQYMNLVQWNIKNVNDMGNIFASCSNLTVVNMSALDINTSLIIRNAFKECSSLYNIDMYNWQTDGCNIFLGGAFNGCRNLVDMNFFETWVNCRIVPSNYTFTSCTNITYLNIRNWDASTVANCSYMWNGCNNLDTLDISGWKWRLSGTNNYWTSPTGYTSYMYPSSSNFKNLIATNWNIYYGNGTAKLFPKWLIPHSRIMNVNLDDWTFNSGTTQTVRNFFNAFYSIGKISLKNWNFGNVMGSLENTFGLTNFDDYSFVENMEISNVNNLNSAFFNSNIVNLDLSRWNIENVITLNRMIENCRKLKYLNLSGWNFYKINNNSGLNNKNFFNNICFASGNLIMDCSNWAFYNTSSIYTTDAHVFKGLYNFVNKNIVNSIWNFSNWSIHDNLTFNGIFLYPFDLDIIQNVLINDWKLYNNVKIIRLFDNINSSWANLDLSNWTVDSTVQLGDSTYGLLNNFKRTVSSDLNMSNWTFIHTDSNFNIANFKEFFKYFKKGTFNFSSVNFDNFDFGPFISLEQAFNSTFDGGYWGTLQLSNLNINTQKYNWIHNLQGLFENTTKSYINIPDWVINGDTFTKINYSNLFNYYCNFYSLNMNNWTFININSSVPFLLTGLWTNTRSNLIFENWNFINANTTNWAYLFSGITVSQGGIGFENFKFNDNAFDQPYNLSGTFSNISCPSSGDWGVLNLLTFEGLKPSDLSYTFGDTLVDSILYPSSWNTSLVKNMNSTFIGVLGNVDIDGWNMHNVTDFGYTFAGIPSGAPHRIRFNNCVINEKNGAFDSNTFTGADTSSIVYFSYSDGNVIGKNTTTLNTLEALKMLPPRTSLSLNNVTISDITSINWFKTGWGNLMSLSLSNIYTSLDNNITLMNNFFDGLSNRLSSLTFRDCFGIENWTTINYMFNKCNYNGISFNLQGWNLNGINTEQDWANIFNGSLYRIHVLNLVDWAVEPLNWVPNFVTNKYVNYIDMSNWTYLHNLNWIDFDFANKYSLLKINLANWHRSMLVYSNFNFDGCSSLYDIDLTGWDLDHPNIMDPIFTFKGCNNLSNNALQNIANALVSGTSITDLNLYPNYEYSIFYQSQKYINSATVGEEITNILNSRNYSIPE